MNFKTGPSSINHIGWGIASGFLFPALSLFVYYKSQYGYMGKWQFFNYLNTGGILTHVITMCVLVNLLLFFLFINTGRDNSARGVLLSTFVYAGFIFYLKYYG